MEPTSTSLATGGILGSAGVGRRAAPRREPIRAPRPRRGYRVEVRRARLPRPHRYARWPWVQSPPGNWIAPAGSNRSGGGGNETAGAFDGKGQRVAPRAGRPQRAVNAEQAPKAMMWE